MQGWFQVCSNEKLLHESVGDRWVNYVENMWYIRNYRDSQIKNNWNDYKLNSYVRHKIEIFDI